MLTMRPSRVLRKLREGEQVLVYSHKFNSPRPIEIASMHGFDCHWICREHTTGDWAALEAQILAAKVWDTDVMVRVGRGSYSDYVRPLELDASGIMVPHVMTEAEAKWIARTTRFMPVGRRPLDGGNADGLYANIGAQQYVRAANEQRFVLVQIEDPEAMDELEGICAVEGIDIVLFGPGDFSHAIGKAGRFDAPEVVEARRRVVETARRHGKFAGTTCAPEQVHAYREMGYQFLAVGGDVGGLSAHCRDLVRRCGVRADDAPR